MNVRRSRVATSLLSVLGALAAGSPSAQTMLSEIRGAAQPSWHTYVFVSTGMPRSRLVELAREASAADAVLVFRGFAQPAEGGAGAPVSLQALQTLVAEVDASCCQAKKPAWTVDPKLFERYRITAAPSFCLAWGEAGRVQDFSAIAGDMALGNALKFMAQQSALPGIRKRAAAIYQEAFGGRS